MIIDYEQIKSDIRKRRYRHIGSGTGRRVYDLGNGYVLKEAKNRRGIAQNKEEHRLYTTSNSTILAKVLSVSDNYKYLIMEKAEKVYRISEVWKHFNVRNNKQLLKIKEFSDLSKYGLLMGDFRRSDSWGIIKGRLVVIDYGFTKRVRKLYYFF